MNSFWKLILGLSGICFLIGILSVVVIVVGFFIGIFVSMLVPVAIVFTVLGFIWVICKDFDSDEKSD